MGMTMDWSKIGCIQEPPVQVRKAEPLARHTSFRIGGPADYMAFPASQARLGVFAAHGLAGEANCGNPGRGDECPGGGCGQAGTDDLHPGAGRHPPAG